MRLALWMMALILALLRRCPGWRATLEFSYRHTGDHFNLEIIKRLAEIFLLRKCIPAQSGLHRPAQDSNNIRHHAAVSHSSFMITVRDIIEIPFTTGN